jgi:hypothetical protein
LSKRKFSAIEAIGRICNAATALSFAVIFRANLGEAAQNPAFRAAVLRQLRKMKESKPKACAHCRTVRYPIHAKGYCKDCYGLVRRKKQIEAWDWDDPATLKDYPPAYPRPREVPSKIPEDSPINPRNEFLNLKAHELKIINDRLRRLRSREIRLSGPIKGMDIELMLRHLAEHAGLETGLFFARSRAQ